MVDVDLESIKNLYAQIPDVARYVTVAALGFGYAAFMSCWVDKEIKKEKAAEEFAKKTIESIFEMAAPIPDLNINQENNTNYASNITEFLYELGVHWTAKVNSDNMKNTGFQSLVLTQNYDGYFSEDSGNKVILYSLGKGLAYLRLPDNLSFGELSNNEAKVSIILQSKGYDYNVSTNDFFGIQKRVSSNAQIPAELIILEKILGEYHLQK